MEEINAAEGILGHPLVLRVKDTQSLTEKTAGAVTDLIDNDKVAAIIGEIATDRSRVAAPIAQARGVPLISPGSANEQVTQAGDSVFRICYTDSFQAVVMAKFARSMQVQRAAILSDPSESLQRGARGDLQKRLPRSRRHDRRGEAYSPGDAGFGRQVDAIRAKIPRSSSCRATIPMRRASFAEHGRRDSTCRFSRDGGRVGFAGVSEDRRKRRGHTCYFSGHFSAENKAPNVAAFVQAFNQKATALRRHRWRRSATAPFVSPQTPSHVPAPRRVPPCGMRCSNKRFFRESPDHISLDANRQPRQERRDHPCGKRQVHLPRDRRALTKNFEDIFAR